MTAVRNGPFTWWSIKDGCGLSQPENDIELSRVIPWHCVAHNNDYKLCIIFCWSHVRGNWRCPHFYGIRLRSNGWEWLKLECGRFAEEFQETAARGNDNSEGSSQNKTNAHKKWFFDDGTLLRFFIADSDSLFYLFFYHVFFLFFLFKHRWRRAAFRFASLFVRREISIELLEISRRFFPDSWPIWLADFHFYLPIK